MAFLAAGLGRRAKSDRGLAGDQRRLARRARLLERAGDRLRIMSVDAGRRPAGRLEPLHLVDRVGQRQRAVDGDAVVVEQHHELVQLEVSGQRDRLLADAFHQVAVGREHIGVVVDDVLAELRGKVRFGNRHADRVGKALAERPGGGLDPRGHVALGMARGERAGLPEALDLRHGHLRIAEEMQHGIEQHRAVPGREHEPVAVGPGGVVRVEFHRLGEQDGRDIGRAHGQSGMARFCLLDRVHGERSDGIGHVVMLGARRWARRGCTRRGCGRSGGERRHGIPIRVGAAGVLARGSTMGAKRVNQTPVKSALPCTRQGRTGVV